MILAIYSVEGFRKLDFKVGHEIAELFPFQQEKVKKKFGSFDNGSIKPKFLNPSMEFISLVSDMLFTDRDCSFLVKDSEGMEYYFMGYIMSQTLYDETYINCRGLDFVIALNSDIYYKEPEDMSWLMKKRVRDW